MNVTFRTTENADALEFRHEPDWILSGQTVTLNPIAPGAFDGLFPMSAREARVRKRPIPAKSFPIVELASGAKVAINEERAWSRP